MHVTRDAASNTYGFHIPQHVFDLVPDRAFQQIVESIAESYCAEFEKEIRASIDKKKLTESVVAYIAKKMGDSVLKKIETDVGKV